MTLHRAIGLMSGTSLDGLDAVLVEIGDRYLIRKLHHVHAPYPAGWAEAARGISERNSLVESAAYAAAWSEFAARAVKKLLKKAKSQPQDIDVIGAHGQTVAHAPTPRNYLGEKVSFTIQLADLSRLAIRTGIDVVGNFRTADVAVGGEGAPLVPHAHRLLFGKPKQTIAVQNLGGIGNVTLLKNNRVELAFDTGPANLWIDTVTRWKTGNRLSFDKDGALARKGQPDAKLVMKLLAHPYFKRRPPKSAGWEDFGPAVLGWYRKSFNKLSTQDALATVTLATAYATADAYCRFVFPRGVPETLILAGGGSKNLCLVELLRTLLPETKITPSDEFGIPVDQLEAISFAIFALETIQRKPSNEPRATGAKRPVICGQVAYAEPHEKRFKSTCFFA